MTSNTSHPGHTYDAVADAYARVRAAAHAELGRDLVAAVAPPFGGRVLDVGAGTGVAATAAVAAVGTAGFVVAADPSIGLLARAPQSSRFVRVVAAAPGLCFAPEQFDALLANVVLSHFADYRSALTDLVRVLRPGGRLGVTTWGRLDDGPPIDDRAERRAYEVWDSVAAEVADLDRLDAHAAAETPWEDHFTDPANLRSALGAADLHHIEVTGRAYRYHLSHDDWLLGAQTSARGRSLRRQLGIDALDEFHRATAARLHERRIPDPIPCVDEALVAVGTRSGRRGHLA